jgi:phage shock protein E
MKKIIAVIFASSLVFAGCSSDSAVSSLGAPEFVSQSQVDGIIVIDVRTPAEFDQGHIANSINIDVQSASFDAEIAALDKNATYALYCRSGNRSGIAAEKMVDSGFIKIINANVGFEDLVRAGAIPA